MAAACLSAAAQVSIVDVDIALARDKMITPRNHVLNDRRPEQYTTLIESEP